MKHSVQFSDAVHLLAYIAIFHDSNRLSSTDIAASIQTNPSNVRKIMRQLRDADLIETTNGIPKPCLVKDPHDISFFDIYQSLGHAQLFQIDNNTESKCIVGGNIQDVLSDEYLLLQQVVEEKMKHIFLSSVLQKISQAELTKNPMNQHFVSEFL
ncbi:Rrf2 family transcriptional regulator [Weissella paramesenteroides]|uniref:Rrf2 family transcriptional regulator n=1 Tax=Weissella paramesenteroides TaxID=1249 RepID=UPI00123C7993|nr:Rrf2 family transcriptional regulator [Weissella paramesenteroides]KAA8447821.1 Rrf2 family transcriptional regulator [Weissella paramesenteroides]KAA8450446.1 Rrf2 family transcriptional regulator [Weissella paramesenteroides]